MNKRQYFLRFVVYKILNLLFSQVFTGFHSKVSFHIVQSISGERNSGKNLETDIDTI